MITRLDRLIEALMGTCMSLDDACDSINFQKDELTMDELCNLDCHIFQCECGWWCDTGEMNDGSLCDDCMED